MLSTQVFGQALREREFTHYSGVPCSFLKPLINYAINHCDYYGMANEGDAIAAAAGAALGGKKAVALMQNSGLTNATSPITSLLYTFKIPILMCISHRGAPGVSDEPQHELMGAITTDLLDTMQVPWAYLTQDEQELAAQLDEVETHMAQGRAFAFVVKKGTFSDETLQDQAAVTHTKSRLIDTEKPCEYPTRLSALDTIVRHKDSHTTLLATTGKCGRELFEVDDDASQLYMVGSMGCISSLGLGLATAMPNKKIIAIDGDGALLMRMGNLASLGYYAPPNLLHIVLDNHTHDSTGGQATVSEHMSFPTLATGCGYPVVVSAHSLEEFSQAIAQWNAEPALTFLHLHTAKGSKSELGRPTITPAQVKDRLMAFLGTAS